MTTALNTTKALAAATFAGMLSVTGLFQLDIIVFGCFGAITAIVLIPQEARHMWTAIAAGLGGVLVAATFGPLVASLGIAIGENYWPKISDFTRELRPCVAFSLGLIGLPLAGKLYRFLDNASNDPRTYIGGIAAKLFKKSDKNEPQK